eukprot:229019_1
MAEAKQPFADEVSSMTESDSDSSDPDRDPFDHDTDSDIQVENASDTECSEYTPSNSDNYTDSDDKDCLDDISNTHRTKSMKHHANHNRKRTFKSNSSQNKKGKWKLYEFNNLRKNTMHYKHQFEPTKRTPSKPNMYFFKTQYQKMPRHLKEAIGAVGVPGYTTEKMAKNGFLSAFQIWRLQWSVPNLDKDICRFTNKRADKRKIPQWKTICVPLLFMVLIIKLIMGLYIYPQVSDYWDDESGFVLIKDIMSRDVFKMYSPHLCAYDMDAEHLMSHENDTGYKGSYPWEQYSQYAEKYLSMTSDISVDERMVDWKGRFRGKCKIKTKRHKEGLKIMQVCENGGYTYHAKLHTLSWLKDMQKEYSETKHTTGGRVILSLIKQCKIKAGTCIHHDNYFTNYHALKEALKQRVYCNGPARARSRGSAYYKLKSLKYTNHKFYHCINEDDPIVNTGIQDGSKFFHMLSSLPHDFTKEAPAKDPTVHWTHPYYNTEKHPSFQRCIANHLYVNHMGGVDRSNQLSNEYSCNRKASKWVTKNLNGFLDLTVTNALILYNRTTGKHVGTITKRDFIKHVAKVGPKHLAKIYLQNHAKWVSRVKGKNHSASETKTILKQRFAPQGIACVYKEKNMKQKYHFKKNRKALSNRVINQ